MIFFCQNFIDFIVPWYRLSGALFRVVVNIMFSTISYQNTMMSKQNFYQIFSFHETMSCSTFLIPMMGSFVNKWYKSNKCSFKS